MNRTLRSVLSLLLCGIVLLSCAAAEPTNEELLATFSVHHASREINKIAITMDDVNEPEYVWKCVELCRQYGIAMTFFPVGVNVKEEDADNWRDVLDAGCEIGCHSLTHIHFSNLDKAEVFRRLGRFQEILDGVLGFHYQVRWFRPPYGTIKSDGDNTRTIVQSLRTFGYNNILLWDISETNAKKAIKNVRNGSILLFHARKKDYECLEELVPLLLEAGFEPVTVSALFDLDPPATSEEPYVFDRSHFVPPQ